MQSVFQPSELEQYIKMSKREKEEQLMELMCIVAGIRLFNRDCQRGGEGIDDCEFLTIIVLQIQYCITNTNNCQGKTDH